MRWSFHDFDLGRGIDLGKGLMVCSHITRIITACSQHVCPLLMLLPNSSASCFSLLGLFSDYVLTPIKINLPSRKGSGLSSSGRI